MTKKSETKPYLVRAYKVDDRSGIIDLWERVFPDEPDWNEADEMITTKLQVQPDLFLVCVVGTQVVGTTLAGFDGVRGWVHKVAVHPEYQRRGIARRLMRAAEEGLVARGCRKLNLQVHTANTAALEFYQQAGYVAEDRISVGKLLSASSGD